MTADYVKPKDGLEGELVCSRCGAHPISKNGSWVITRFCHECGARIEKKPSTWYEDERSRILYTCEEKYDGNMVAYVIDLESQLIGMKLERDQLMADLKSGFSICNFCKYDKFMVTHCDESDFDCVACRHTEECKCLGCTNKNNMWEWRGMPDEKGSDRA